MRTTCTVTITAALTLLIVPAYGQDAGDLVNIEPLQKKAEALTSEELKVVDAWLAAHFDELNTALTTPVSEDYSEGRKRAAVVREIRLLQSAANGTDAYRGAYVQALAKRVEGTREEQTDVQLTVTTLAILVRLAGPGQAETFVRMLDSEKPSVQYWAVRGLLELRDALSAAQKDSIRPALEALVKKTEQGPLAGLVYSFFDQPDSAASRSGLVGLLQWRAGQYAKKVFSALEGDRDLFDASVRAYAAGSEAQKRAILTALGSMLRHSARFRAGSAGEVTSQLVENLDFAIFSLETALGRITRRSQTQPVLEALKEADADALAPALATWLGNSEREGILNGSPYNLPRGLGAGSSSASTQPATDQGGS